MEITDADAHISPKKRADREESRIQEIQSKILELRKQVCLTPRSVEGRPLINTALV